jgi:hypothetical protein
MLCQVMSGYVRLLLFRHDYFKLGQVISGYFMLSHVMPR